MVSVMFVCLGNICRSPAGEGILLSLAEKCDLSSYLKVASSGIGDWHIGKLPDERMRQAALERGIILMNKAQLFDLSHFDEYDYILAADHEVLKSLYQFARSPQDKLKVHLATAFGQSYRNEEVPDPYYGGVRDFELVLDMFEDACEGLLQEIKRKLGHE